MNNQAMAIELPPLLYQVDSSSITKFGGADNVPTLPDDLPEPKRQLLVQLETLGDEALWQVAYRGQ
jgi:hypothetical protein